MFTFLFDFRATRVEQDSVNSVVLCEEPQDKHPRMLVAAAINMNSAGNAMIARYWRKCIVDFFGGNWTLRSLPCRGYSLYIVLRKLIFCRETTYLPNIHGLSSMIPLLFAPVAEFRYNAQCPCISCCVLQWESNYNIFQTWFRCDQDETHISGVICGLGCDETGAPILPDHDIEIAFDVKFGEQDYGMVCLSFAVCCCCFCQQVDPSVNASITVTFYTLHLFFFPIFNSLRI